MTRLMFVLFTLSTLTASLACSSDSTSSGDDTGGDAQCEKLYECYGACDESATDDASWETCATACDADAPEECVVEICDEAATCYMKCDTDHPDDQAGWEACAVECDKIECDG